MTSEQQRVSSGVKTCALSQECPEDGQRPKEPSLADPPVTAAFTLNTQTGSNSWSKGRTPKAQDRERDLPDLAGRFSCFYTDQNLPSSLAQSKCAVWGSEKYTGSLYKFSTIFTMLWSLFGVLCFDDSFIHPCFYDQPQGCFKQLFLPPGLQSSTDAQNRYPSLPFLLWVASTFFILESPPHSLGSL